MVGIVLGTKRKNPINLSSIKGREVAMNRGYRQREEGRKKNTQKGKEKRNLTKENKKTKW